MQRKRSSLTVSQSEYTQATLTRSFESQSLLPFTNKKKAAENSYSPLIKTFHLNCTKKQQQQHYQVNKIKKRQTGTISYHHCRRRLGRRRSYRTYTRVYEYVFLTYLATLTFSIIVGVYIVLYE